MLQSDLCPRDQSSGHRRRSRSPAPAEGGSGAWVCAPPPHEGFPPPPHPPFHPLPLPSAVGRLPHLPGGHPHTTQPHPAPQARSLPGPRGSERGRRGQRRPEQRGPRRPGPWAQEPRLAAFPRAGPCVRLAIRFPRGACLPAPLTARQVCSAFYIQDILSLRVAKTSCSRAALARLPATNAASSRPGPGCGPATARLTRAGREPSHRRVRCSAGPRLPGTKRRVFTARRPADRRTIR